MKLTDLSIVYCKDCRSYKEQKVDEHSSICSCTKDSDSFEWDEPRLYRHRKCFSFKKKRNNT